MDLNTAWFVLVGTLFAGYAILDGFDFGVGMLHLFTTTDDERRAMINAIGPVWDGNEVWLVTGGGALFAAFPDVYATVFSGFYIPLMLLVACLIFRAISIEFRSKEPWPWWRRMWDVAFGASSLVAALLVGVALGNVIWGVPLGADKEFHGTFLGMLHPYALLVGVTTVALFAMHGSIYALMKIEGPLWYRLQRWIPNCVIFFIVSYALLTLATLVYAPHMVARIKEHPAWFVLPVTGLLAIANIPREVYHGRERRAFASSSAAIATLMALCAVGIFPNLVASRPNPENSLTVWNSASSPRTLRIMLTIAAIGMPIVISYTISIYWIFRGKVRLDSRSY